MTRYAVGIIAVFMIVGCGKQGTSDLVGPPGPKGDQGDPGVGCSVQQVTGGAMVVCSDFQVFVANGTNGTNGQDAHPVLPVKLCQDDTTQYPEFGVDIWNPTLGQYDLYGVYWGSAPSSYGFNTAFMAKLTPGNYVSTGGNGCHFTVNADGSISE